MSLTNRRVFCIITGASRGIGREIVLQLSKILSNDSAFLITARSFPALNNLKEELLQMFVFRFVLFPCSQFRGLS
ncbi:hypothetical protein AB6A40_006934 [Gnathostoma spinigerum]|uniref:Uncharacterized protein n=1 Tax=Gnathostoma spinigerum TaxID=75299 RepID=A0ABD6EJS9_9BILA